MLLNVLSLIPVRFESFRKTLIVERYMQRAVVPLATNSVFM